MKAMPHEKKHLKQLRRILSECAVLLKSNGDFPLDHVCSLALYGSGARRTVYGGTGSGEVNSRFNVSIEKALHRAGFTVTTKEWLDEYDRIVENARAQFLRQIKKGAWKNPLKTIVDCMGAVMPEPDYVLPITEEGDAAIYVLSRISGEGSDRIPCPGDVLLTRTEIRDILALQKRFRKFLLVLNVGGPVDLSPVMEVENILLLSQLGTMTGIALADILLGRSAPSGKLTATWSAWKDCPGIGDFGEPDNTRYTEGIYVGYRYFDSTGTEPLFPFGYGLSFTDFSILDMEIQKQKGLVTVSAIVQNTGRRSGKETLQVYVSVPSGQLDQPYQSLAGFKKTKLLAPGMSENVSITFSLRDLASFCEDDDAYILEPGRYLLRLGTNSRDTAAAGVLQIRDRIVVRRVGRLLGETDFTDWKPERQCDLNIPSGLPVLSFTDEDIAEETVRYDTDMESDPVILGMSDEELICMNIGSFRSGFAVSDIIGSSSRSVAGAAGETSGVLQEKGVGVLVMADGPAGLRLSRKFFRDQKGVHSIGMPLPATVADLLPSPVLRLADHMTRKPGRGDEVLSQYATSIPVGTALAQSWNPEAASLCGDIVGEEMELFGVHLWLAPALNIHRSILCGRNYEYYSEDPLLSGLIAAAVTRGVQKHSGCGTTIKHFAANNQEFRRYTNNSIVSRRALREIYLRGFEICIRESAPCAVMTSYNLINAQHASERKDLIEGVLRGEFGFTGIVMTDWTIAGFGSAGSVHPEAKADRISKAGVGLVMPGSKEDYERIRKALEGGQIRRAQLERNASYTVRMIRRLKQNQGRRDEIS